MLGGGDEHTLAHQAGCVADFGDVLIRRGDGKMFQVRPQENDAGGLRGGFDSDRDGHSAVESDSCGFDGVKYRCFVSHVVLQS